MAIAMRFVAATVVFLVANTATTRGVSVRSTTLSRRTRRTSDAADPATAHAVDLLKGYGLLHGPMPRVLLVAPDDLPEQPVIASLRAFRLARDGAVDPVVYVVRTNAVYRLAERGSSNGIALLASTIRHELVHGDGGDERAAVAAEIQFLHRYVLTERTASESLVWQIRALEGTLTNPQLAAADTVRRTFSPGPQ